MTNFKTVKQSVRRLKESEAMFSDGTAERLSKKERLSMTREMEKLESSLGGIKNIPLVLVGDENYDILDSTIAIKRKERAIGIVVSEGVLYNSLDVKFYIEVQTFYDLKYDFVDSCKFTVVDDVLNMTAFVIYE